MMAAFSSTSAPVQTFSLKTPDPMCRTIVVGPYLDELEESGYKTAPTEFSMDQLQFDFQQILRLQVKGANFTSNPSSTTDSSSLALDFSLTDEDFSGYRGLSPTDCRDLRLIAAKLSSKNCLDKLVHMYINERKAFVNAYFLKCWEEKLSCSDIHRMEWNTLEQKISFWIRAANYAIHFIFSNEKQFANDVFSDFQNGISDSCFIGIVGDYVTQLFDFTEAMSSWRRSPERLKMILLFYKRFSDLMPYIKSLFDSEVAMHIRIRGDDISAKFAEVVVLALNDFEDSVLSDQSNDAFPEGTIHKLTNYVMEYTTNLAVENQETQLKLVTLRPSKFVELLDAPELQRHTPLAQHLLLIIIVLEENLQCKSQSYLDPSLQFLFMMNNLDYIAQKIRQSLELREMIGDSYLEKIDKKIQESLAGYLEESWDGLLHCLNCGGSSVTCSFTYAVSKSALRGRVKNFSLLFEQIQRTQGMWSVPDLDLRAKLHGSILQKMIPAYKSFLGEFGSRIERRKCSEKCAPFTVDELETKIMGLFGYH